MNKLTKDDDAEIYRRVQVEGVPVARVARDYAVTRPTIYAAIARHIKRGTKS